jgi:hypothetical protein
VVIADHGTYYPEPVKRTITLTLAAAAALALAGCGTEVNAQTSKMVASVPGYNVTFTDANGQEVVGVRNAALQYPGPEGYKAGSDAIVDMRLFNNTDQPVVVVINTDAGTVKTDGPITVPPQGIIAPKVSITGLKQAVNFGEPVRVRVEFVGLKEFIDVPLNIVPPASVS